MCCYHVLKGNRQSASINEIDNDICTCFEGDKFLIAGKMFQAESAGIDPGYGRVRAVSIIDPTDIAFFLRSEVDISLRAFLLGDIC